MKTKVNTTNAQQIQTAFATPFRMNIANTPEIRKAVADHANREIHATISILDNWDCLQNISINERKILIGQLQMIAKAAIDDVFSKMTDVRNELIDSINN